MIECMDGCPLFFSINHIDHDKVSTTNRHRGYGHTALIINIFFFYEWWYRTSQSVLRSVLRIYIYVFKNLNNWFKRLNLISIKNCPHKPKFIFFLKTNTLFLYRKKITPFKYSKPCENSDFLPIYKKIIKFFLKFLFKYIILWRLYEQFGWNVLILKIKLSIYNMDLCANCKVS